MALVMLPCDLPWWASVQNHLKKIATTKNTTELVEGMQKIHELCNVSLDPDEEETTPQIFVGLLNFLDNDLTSEERRKFLNVTLPNLVKRALSLKDYKPKDGLHFSLQQQPDCIELDYKFVASLIANAFFSTFPKRTEKSHPTLQDFNFTNFFKHLHINSQKSKLRSIIYYFDWLEEVDNDSGSIRLLRQVMSSKEWLTIEDWLECNLPLCPLQIKNEGKMERNNSDCLQVCFSSSKIGKHVLSDGNAQESITLVTFPELLCVLLNVEALEDNEILTVERVRQISQVNNPKTKAHLEKLDESREKSICCIDAEDYTNLPLSQYEEDNILRELNKCLLAFQQKQSRIDGRSAIVPNRQMQQRSRRLSPIGESMGSNASDANIPLITQESCSTTRSKSKSPPRESTNKNLKVQKDNKRYIAQEGIFNNRRGRFIVLGSSGECLPVKRKPPESSTSLYSSVDSSEDEFHSAKTSLDEESEDELEEKYNKDLQTAEKRCTFAQRLRDALRRETSSQTTASEDSNYAVGILVAGSGLGDQDIKLRRGGSRGFMLNDEDDIESMPQDVWVDKFKSRHPNLSKKGSHKSSDYSFSTDYSSELEEVYEQFSKWLQDPILETDTGTKRKRELDSRDLAVVQFAGSLLKRALSESFAGVPLTNGCENATEPDFSGTKKNKLVLNAKSLSLELARHKHRLAAQLNQPLEVLPAAPALNKQEKTFSKKPKKSKRASFILSYRSQIIQTLEEDIINVVIPEEKLSQISQQHKNGIKPVISGNWGCGQSKQGEVQLKVIIQWLAASVAGVPSLIYYTCGHSDLVTLDTVYRLLRDRKWTVKDLAEATLRFSHQLLHDKNVSATLFEDLIGVERSS